MKTSAYLTHSVPGRCRMKIPDKRHDINYFESLLPQLNEVAGITQVLVNPLTASVLIQYQEQTLSLQDLKSRLGTMPQFELTSEPKALAVWQDASNRLTGIDNILKQGSAGQFDFRSLLFIVFVILAVRQLQQGAILGSASNLLWYAAQLIMAKK